MFVIDTLIFIFGITCVLFYDSN